VITDAKGGSFYRDHLPLLGTVVLLYIAIGSTFKTGSYFWSQSWVFCSVQLWFSFRQWMPTYCCE